MVEKEKNEIRFFPQHPGIYENYLMIIFSGRSSIFILN
jgi:hypothetical protein